MQVFKLSPLVGEGVNRQVDGRGKCEQTQKNDSNLCTQACPYRLEWLGTSLRVRGKLTLRKKEFIVLLFKYAFCGYPMPDSSLSLITLWFRSAHPHTSAAQE